MPAENTQPKYRQIAEYLRRGILDGSVGFTLSCVNAYAVFLKFAKLRQMARTSSP